MALAADKFSADDYRYMARALKLAEKGRYTTHPNPRVGCVLVKNNRIIGEGYHRKAGEAHAERLAIANASENPEGATAYVTLEPCCHHGKTPPCTDALIEAKLSRVVVAMQDPNSLVAGKGLDLLRQAGVTVAVGLLEQQAVLLNLGFIKRMSHGLPFVRCKLASSIDGKTAMASGESVWITSEASRRDVQLLRAQSSAIMTGSGTVSHDNPSLNVRLNAEDLQIDSDLPVHQPVRVILDTTLQTPTDAKILKQPGQVLLYCGIESQADSSKYSNSKVTVVPVDLHNHKLAIEQVLKDLAERQINEVLLETGATLAGAAIKAGLIDELIVYQAACLMGHEARSLAVLPGIESMSDKINLRLVDHRRIGPDQRLTFSFT
jgi:diaminohydroxyphosphoribosylaminopyrimidine deaminase/5-amino-6-(5-phosphoribosylamino)uracil reductase